MVNLRRMICSLFYHSRSKMIKHYCKHGNTLSQKWWTFLTGNTTLAQRWWTWRIIIGIILSSVIITACCLAVSGALNPHSDDDLERVIASVRPDAIDSGPMRAALQQYASPDRLIVISQADMGYIHLAINIYLSSYKRFHIDNHLFVASDNVTCGVLRKHGANCVQYGVYSGTSISSDYFMDSFKIKNFLKMQLVLVALKENISVLLVDSDIVFLKNPLPYLQRMNTGITIQNDGSLDNLNSGFYLIRASPASQDMFEQCVKDMDGRAYDQPVLNAFLQEFRERGLINQTVLPMDTFQNGNSYFTEGHRNVKGENPCTECYILHNNWIVSTAAKIYRFQQHGFWYVDTDGYYSDASRKYLIYSNPTNYGGTQTSKHRELSALKTALTIGYLLKRTVILPGFHCPVSRRRISDNTTCDLNTLHFLSGVAAQFPDAYRESIFLEHKLVPDAVKTSRSRVHDIAGILHNQAASDPLPVITSSQIQDTFAGDRSSVLQFSHLYFRVAEEELPGALLAALDKTFSKVLFWSGVNELIRILLSLP